MAQFFPKWSNYLAPVIIIVFIGSTLGAVGFIWYYGSPKFTDVGYRPVQPVPFSHRLHAGELGMDCRYCHASVELSHEANIPPTQTCMNCHKMVRPDSENLKLVRDSYEKNIPIPWVRVHKIAEYAYFNHGVHLRAGVGCASCHGNVAKMEIVEQKQPMSMGWCLTCHRDPAMHLRDLNHVSLTNMEWQPSPDHKQIANRIIKEKNLNPPEDCSACHQ